MRQRRSAARFGVENTEKTWTVGALRDLRLMSVIPSGSRYVGNDQDHCPEPQNPTLTGQWSLFLPTSMHSREAAAAGSPRRKPWVTWQFQQTSREAATARCATFAAAASRLTEIRRQRSAGSRRQLSAFVASRLKKMWVKTRTMVSSYVQRMLHNVCLKGFHIKAQGSGSRTSASKRPPWVDDGPIS